MGYSKNSITVQDGGLGVSSASTTNVMAVVGISEKTYSDIITISSLSEIEKKFGEGELRDFLVDAFSFKKKPTAYVLSIAGSIDGTISEVKKTGSSPSLAVTGTPRNEYSVVVEIKGDGDLNAGTFAAYVDNRTVVSKATIPLDGKYVLGNTGLTLNFPAGSYVTGDTFTFDTTAPKATNEELLDAVNKLLASKKKFRFVAVPVVTNYVFWSAFDTLLEGETDKNKFIRGVTMCRDVNSGETVDQYVNVMTGTERGIIQCLRTAVVLSRGKIADAVNGNEDTRSVIGKYCGWMLGNKVYESPAKTELGAVSGITGFASYIENAEKVTFSAGHLKLLDSAGYVTIRDYYEKEGAWFTSGRMLCDETSDYAEIMNCSVMDRVCSVVAETLFKFLNRDVEIGTDGSIAGIENLKSQGQLPLDRLKDITREISSGTFVVPEGQDILSTKNLEYYVEVIPKGYLVTLTGVIRFTNPNAE